MSRVADGSGQMFDAIASTYDRLNRVMSFGLDREWRRALVRAIARTSPRRVLDVATGTGDVLLALRTEFPAAELVGLDPSEGMLAVARSKVTHDPQCRLVTGSVDGLPFESGSFDAVTVAFGLRNFPDRVSGIREMVRVLRPGGILAILELTEPRGLLGPFARAHVHHVVPKLGSVLSRGAPYDYLAKSIAAFPPASGVVSWLQAEGLIAVTARGFALGSVHLFTGQVPERQ